ncbi:hypothetical protein BC830DRAFT_1159086 [Chytriomyces sp. MP71]|nr:hypothetical protein BC830DRAFT_1159086 [Chytriomyces sp. MP71]
MSLETLPSEIRDRIAGSLPGLDMLVLSHAMPYFRPIGSSMMAMSSLYEQLPLLPHVRNRLWPSATLSRRTVSPEALTALRTHLVLLQRCGGQVSLASRSVDDLRQTLDMIPLGVTTNLRLLYLYHPGDAAVAIKLVADRRLKIATFAWRFYGFDEAAEALAAEQLARLSEVRVLDVQMGGLPRSLWAAIPEVRGLTVLRYDGMLDKFPAKLVLPRIMPSLRKLAFLGLGERSHMLQLLTDIGSMGPSSLEVELNLSELAQESKATSRGSSLAMLDTFETDLAADGWIQYRKGPYVYVWKRADEE